MRMYFSKHMNRQEFHREANVIFLFGATLPSCVLTQWLINGVLWDRVAIMEYY